ncbi:hypothetical protein [Aeromicrobium sp. CTD01-1L150]|uniref:hypothetical protein n=1 Tax=Aeromicrobium sp. CTD01-1L150 TaxID=3341830 RepID=UPI0035C04890
MRRKHRRTKPRLPSIYRMWKPPKAKADPAPYGPVGSEVGAPVAWTQEGPAGCRVERSGHIWSKGRRESSVWVVPDELFDGELAVLLVLRSTSEPLYITDQTVALRPPATA